MSRVTYGPAEDATAASGKEAKTSASSPAPGPDDPCFDAVPARYGAGEREAIDQLRDAAGTLLLEALVIGCHPGDAAFAVHCALTARKYRIRKGLKGPPEMDLEKARWYEMMWEHVLGRGPDPRSYRAGFEPYRKKS